jgi:hypothetical protein
LVCVLEREGEEGAGTVGMAALYINDQKVAEEKIQTQLGMFSLTGSMLYVGRDVGEPASSDYESPFAFTGGTIKEALQELLMIIGYSIQCLFIPLNK